MTDFARFCPKCYAFFRDPDLYAKHVAGCGFAKDKAAAEKKRADTVKEPTKKAAKERSQEQGVGSQNTEDNEKENGAGKETPDSCVLTPDSSHTPPVASTKTPKFKT
jgi:uncharacterized C2H2 Zn-finger protein